MPDMLMTTANVLELMPSPYPKCITLRSGGGLFHISVDEVTTTGPFRYPKPPTCEALYRFKNGPDATQFDVFHGQWDVNTAILYRGISGNHFSWGRVKDNGVLRSEGDDDNPTFTMGNPIPTCWIPCDFAANLPAGVAMGNADPHTTAMSQNRDVPVGAVLKVVVGKTLNKPVAWLNAGEIVVKGPLDWPEWGIHNIVWLCPASIDITPWPPGGNHSRLMPVRPYGPNATALTIQNWWANNMGPWLLRAQKVGNILTLL